MLKQGDPVENGASKKEGQNKPDVFDVSDTVNQDRGFDFTGDKGEYLSLTEASKYTKFSQDYLSLMARTGRMPAQKFGRNWKVRMNDVEEYIAKIDKKKSQQEIKKAVAESAPVEKKVAKIVNAIASSDKEIYNPLAVRRLTNFSRHKFQTVMASFLIVTTVALTSLFWLSPTYAGKLENGFDVAKDKVVDVAKQAKDYVATKTKNTVLTVLKHSDNAFEKGEEILDNPDDSLASETKKAGVKTVLGVQKIGEITSHSMAFLESRSAKRKNYILKTIDHSVKQAISQADSMTDDLRQAVKQVALAPTKIIPTPVKQLTDKSLALSQTAITSGTNRLDGGAKEILIRSGQGQVAGISESADDSKESIKERLSATVNNAAQKQKVLAYKIHKESNDNVYNLQNMQKSAGLALVTAVQSTIAKAQNYVQHKVTQGKYAVQGTQEVANEKGGQVWQRVDNGLLALGNSIDTSLVAYQNVVDEETVKSKRSISRFISTSLDLFLPKAFKQKLALLQEQALADTTSPPAPLLIKEGGVIASPTDSSVTPSTTPPPSPLLSDNTSPPAPLLSKEGGDTTPPLASSVEGDLTVDGNMIIFGSADLRSPIYDSDSNLVIDDSVDINKYLTVGKGTGAEVTIGVDDGNSYINFGGSDLGEQGFGFRNQAGFIQYKNKNGSWISLSSLAHSGGGGGSVTNNTYNTTNNTTDGTVTSSSIGQVAYYNAAGDTVIGTSELYIDTTGYIGIGTTSPAVALDIYSTNAIRLPVGTTAQRPTGGTGMLRYNSSNSNFEGYNGSNWSGLGGVIDVDSDTYILAESSSGVDEDALFFYTASTEKMRLTNNGYLGIGTSSPYAMLTIWATSTGATLFSAVNTASSTLFTILNSGNIGIGTTSPNHTLDINGNLGLKESQYINWGYTDGSSGYGLRDNSGTIEYKASGGTWAAIGSGGGSNYGAASSLSFYSASGTTATGTTNALLSWDDTNTRLGVGTSTAYATLSVWGNTSGTGAELFNIVDNASTTLLTVLDTGNVGINDITPTYKLDVNGNARFTSYVDASYFVATSTSATSTFAFDIASASGDFTIHSAGTTNNLLLNPYGGNVGIGTTSPWGLLSVDAPGGKPALVVGSSTTQFIVDASGRVGIGTANPNSLLNLFQTPADLSDNPTLSFGDGDTGFYETADDTLSLSIGTILRYSWSDSAFTGTTNDGFFLLRGAGSAATPSYAFVGDEDTGIYSDASNYLQFSTGASNRMTINSNGYIGIGTSTPYSRLTIWGDGGNIFEAVDNASSTKMIITNSGNVGIGTTSPWGLLSVNPNGISGPSFAIGSSTQTDFIVTNGGNVGIGTTSPYTNLSITGNLGLSGNIIEGTWQGATVGVTYGGTGLSSTPSYGQVLLGNASSGYTLTATSSLGLVADTDFTGTGLMVTTASGAYTNRALATSSDQIIILNPDGVSGAPTFDLRNTAVTSLANLATVGTINVGTWNADTIATTKGGTGLTSYVIGDIIYASAANTLSALATSTAGKILQLDFSTGLPSYVATSSLGLLGSTTVSALTANYIPKWDSSVFSNSVLYDDGTNIGIGTTSPNHKLDINGNLGLKENQYINWGYTDGDSGYGLKDNSGTLQYKSSGGSWTDMGAGSGTINYGAASSLAFYSVSGTTATGTTNALLSWDDTNARLGVGTSTAYATLSVWGKTSGTGMALFNVVDNASTTLLTILDTGRIGIGTTTPTAKLTIQGTAGQNIFTVASSTGATIMTINSQGKLVLNSTSGSSDYEITPNDGLLGIDGYLGVGTSTPVHELSVTGSAYITGSLFFADGSFMNKASGWEVASNLVTLSTASDKVGIGTSSPYAKLSLVHTSASAGEDIFVISTSTSGLIFKVNAYGATYADGAYSSPAADYAEYYYTIDTDLQSGEAVCVDIERDNAVKRCARGADGNLMGIISTKPAIIGNSPLGRENNPNYAVVGILGQVPAFVSDENGPIRPGDSLTSASSTPGYAMKAGPSDPTVGVALESLIGETGKINVLISRRNKSLTVEEVEQQIIERIAAMEIEDEVAILVANAVDGYDFDPVVTEIIGGELALLSTKFDGALTVQKDELTNLINSKTLTTDQSLVALASAVDGLAVAVDENGSLISELQEESELLNGYIVELLRQREQTDITGNSSTTILTVAQSGDGNIAEFKNASTTVLAIIAGRNSYSCSDQQSDCPFEAVVKIADNMALAFGDEENVTFAYNPDEHKMEIISSDEDLYIGLGTGRMIIAGAFETLPPPDPLLSKEGELALEVRGSTGVNTHASSTATALTVEQNGSGDIVEFRNATLAVMTIANDGDVEIAGGNLEVCVGACPDTESFIPGSEGDLGVEASVFAKDYRVHCPDGWVEVPRDNKHTFQNFCVQKYALTPDPSPAGRGEPALTNVTLSEAKDYCRSLGDGNHLVTDAEWMTIAENISALPINDMSEDLGIQLSNGISSGSNVVSMAEAEDPNIDGCNLYASLGNEENAFSETCQLRGTNGNTSDFGYTGTETDYSVAYDVSSVSRSSIRTAVLSNGQIIWDVAGNAAEWVDNLVIASEQPSSTKATEGKPIWLEYSEITKYANMSNIRPSGYNWTSANGIGQIYTDYDAGSATRGSVRGGSYLDGERAGVFSLNLSNSPDYFGDEVGFRCAK